MIYDSGSNKDRIFLFINYNLLSDTDYKTTLTSKGFQGFGNNSATNPSKTSETTTQRKENILLCADRTVSIKSIRKLTYSGLQYQEYKKVQIHTSVKLNKLCRF